MPPRTCPIGSAGPAAPAPRPSSAALANNLGGEVRVIAARRHDPCPPSGKPPDGDVAQLHLPIEVDGTTAGDAGGRPPGRVSDRGFLPLFNVTLIVAGLLSVDRRSRSPRRSSRPPDPAPPRRDRGGAASRARRPGRPGDRRRRPRIRRARRLPSTRWPTASNAPRCSAGAPRATSRTTWPRRPPSSNRSSRRWSTASCPPTAPDLEAARSAASALGQRGGRPRRPRERRGGAAPGPTRPRSTSAAAVREVERWSSTGSAASASVRASSRRGPGRDVVALGRPRPPRAGPPQRHRQRASPTAPTGGRVTGRGATRGPRRRGRDPRRATRARASPPADLAARLRALLPRRPGPGPRPARPAARTGSGLGLTIARELLAANGGRIEVERTGPGRDDVPDRAPEAAPPSRERASRPVAPWSSSVSSIGAITGGSGSSIGGSSGRP